MLSILGIDASLIANLCIPAFFQPPTQSENMTLLNEKEESGCMKWMKRGKTAFITIGLHLISGLLYTIISIIYFFTNSIVKYETKLYLGKAIGISYLVGCIVYLIILVLYYKVTIA